MPLFRYNTGDLVELDSDTAQGYIKRIAGRAKDLLFDKNNSPVTVAELKAL